MIQSCTLHPVGFLCSFNSCNQLVSGVKRSVCTLSVCKLYCKCVTTVDTLFHFSLISRTCRRASTSPVRWCCSPLALGLARPAREIGVYTHNTRLAVARIIHMRCRDTAWWFRTIFPFVLRCMAGLVRKGAKLGPYAGEGRRRGTSLERRTCMFIGIPIPIYATAVPTTPPTNARSQSRRCKL